MLLSELLESTGYPVAYREFKKAPSIPYIVYMRDNDTNISSDHKVHGKVKYYTVVALTQGCMHEDKRLAFEFQIVGPEAFRSYGAH
jgi:hypothetical protein